MFKATLRGNDIGGWVVWTQQAESFVNEGVDLILVAFG
jgi:hypothetical protein